MKLKNKTGHKVILISEYPPPAAGMTVQAHQLLACLQSSECNIIPIRTNPELRNFLEFLNSIRFLKGFIKWIIFIVNCRKIIGSNIVHIFSSSGLNFYLFTIPPLLIARASSAKTIVNFHGGAAQNFFRNRQALLKWSMRYTDALVVPSGYLQSVFNNFGFTSRIIGNIANLEQFSFKLREIARPVIISVRNLTPVYNVGCALKAFSIVQTQYPEAVIYIAGDGPERPELEALRDELMLRNVYFLGNLKNTELVKYLEKANLFINSSTLDNMPVSIIEAFAIGLPVVSTNVGGIPFLVEHERTGLLANNNDYRTLAAHLIRLVENPEFAGFLVNNANKEVQCFAGNKIKAEWLDLYEQLYPK